MKTIYALSTFYGKSGVAVIRISGEDAYQVVSKMTDLKKLNPRQAYFTTIKDVSSNTELDKSLILFFESPNSFTGEDVVELHIHGSKAVIASVLDNLSKIKNFRLAEPGEFSKRAFYNGKMDLTEAEGLADLIESETTAQQQYALKQMSGGLKNLYDNWREDIIKILAHIEAYIDFPEEDIPDNIKKNLLNTVFKLTKEVEKHLSQSNIGERLRDGFKVVIVGPPNAGKSSLLNWLAKREAAIVSDIAGTTRDAIDIHLDIKGYPVIFTDTAGLRETDEVIENKGVEIAHQKMQGADLIICLFDASKDSVQLFDNIAKAFQNVIIVGNKSDLVSQQNPVQNQQNSISIKNNIGMESLLDAIYNNIQSRVSASTGALITRHRYREALEETLEHLKNFNLDKEIELSAEDIRLAARNLGKITGRIEVDDVLNKIFSDFCIGK